MVKFIVRFSFVFIIPFIQGCGSEARAESPCPTSVNEISISLIDSINGESVETAEVTVLGNVYDNHSNEVSNQEILLSYSPDQKRYYLDTSIYDIEIEQRNFTLYSLDNSYHYNVSRAYYEDFKCTSMEKVIYLCPKGTSCR